MGRKKTDRSTLEYVHLYNRTWKRIKRRDKEIKKLKERIAELEIMYL